MRRLSGRAAGVKPALALAAGGLLLLAGFATPSWSGAPPLDDCDRLAASALDPGRRGPGVSWDQIDPARAVPACRAALQRFPGSPRFKFQYGRALHKAGEQAEAANWYRDAAGQGFAPAQNNLGVMYTNGHGVPRDDAEAVKWHRMAAEQGYVVGQYKLGLMYLLGQGVPRDDALAATWYREAAEQGFALAQNNLGAMYQTGQGVPKDYGEAVKWYRMAAGQGSAVAQYNLGVT